MEKIQIQIRSFCVIIVTIRLDLKFIQLNL